MRSCPKAACPDSVQSSSTENGCITALTAWEVGELHPEVDSHPQPVREQLRLGRSWLLRNLAFRFVGYDRVPVAGGSRIMNSEGLVLSPQSL